MHQVPDVPGWQERLFLPGPTPLPWAVAQAGARPMTDPRTDGFTELASATLGAIARMAGTTGQATAVPATGTGALEALCQNLFQPGDPVLVLVAGAFGKRFADVARRQGLAVDTLEVPMGDVPTVEAIGAALEKGPTASSHATFRGLLMTHNETSTGVLLPVSAFARRAREIHPDLLCVVDSISGFPSIPLDMDESGIDAAAAASQKGFMAPPGLAIVVLGPRGVSSCLAERTGRFYFDLGPFLKGHFPYTAPVSLWYALAEGVRLLEEEGQAARTARHVVLGQMARASGTALSVPPRAPEASASPTVTALQLPEGLSPGTLRAEMARQGVRIAGAMGAWSGDTVRIGHVGAVLPVDLMGAVAALEDALIRHDHSVGRTPPFRPGDGVRAAFLKLHHAFEEAEV